MNRHDSPEPKPAEKDRVIADSGWGIKPDDQPANAAHTPQDRRKYQYDPDEAEAVRNILQTMRHGFNTPNRILVEAGRTTIYDINGDAFVIEGLFFGDEKLIELLKTVGAGFDPLQLAKLGKDYDGVREYTLTRAWAWGAERTG